MLALQHRSRTILSFTQTVALALFGLTYLTVAIGRLPGLRLDRAGAALVGASLMVAFGVLPLEDAFRAIDFNTLTLLFGMMILVANLRLSGFFHAISHVAARRVRSPFRLLLAVVILSGGLSAFLVNDSICLVLTPLVLDLVLRLGRDPIPYLLAIAMASNIGSVATITGNPQNMIIGTLSGISYGTFSTALAPVAAIGLVIVVASLVLAYPREFLSGKPLSNEDSPSRHRPNPTLIVKTLTVAALMVVGFLSGIAPAKVAIVGGALLLLTRRVKPKRVYAEIDWTLLLMFAGLFIVVNGLERSLLSPEILERAVRSGLERPVVLAGVTAALSNLVSNVPAVLLLKPFLATFHDPDRAWLCIAMASTLAGNFTLLGSVANLIVAERARAYGVTLSFGAYFRVGAPLTLLTLAVGLWFLSSAGLGVPVGRNGPL